MPIQRFAPMTKDFATFDCDAHVTEPPLIWERAADHLTREELAALKETIWWDDETQQLIVHGKAGVGIGSPRRGGIPGTMPMMPTMPPVNASACGLASTCVINCCPVSWSVLTRLTTRPAAVDMISAGICATRPSPMVSRV